MYKGIFHSLLLLFVLSSCNPVKAGPEQMFANANKQYASGLFAEAATTYQQIIDSGYHTSELYYNLGNAYYKLNEYPSAILYYEKAYKLQPDDEDIKVNLQLANSKIADKIEAVPEFFLAEWWRTFVMMFSLTTWSVLAVLGVLIGSGLLVVYLVSLRLSVKKAAFFSGVLLILAGLFCVLVANAQNRYFEARKHVIIFDGVVEVKSGPQKESRSLFVVHEGLKVSVKGRESGWLKVALPNGNIGWIESLKVKEI